MILNSSNLWNRVEVFVPNLFKLPARLKKVLPRIRCHPKITDDDLKHVSYFFKLQTLNMGV